MRDYKPINPIIRLGGYGVWLYRMPRGQFLFWHSRLDGGYIIVLLGLNLIWGKR